ncbi:hypothetical protein TARUN_3158 [Trichoderma arundinaceum]|uniref:Uncharacterized protein n=1 Tax=Trichoderma arundinaceum TaxID=490622 RepID=A0A395NSK2_TRIAR|nr:hypothetical protein TARUN_3158 [Trichoderma arundinaceum]
MDALGAISLAGNVVQFVEYAIIAVAKAAEIFNSADGRLREDAELELIVNDVKSSFQSVHPSEDTGNKVSVSDKDLNHLIEKCDLVADDIMTILETCRLKVKQTRATTDFFQAFGKASKSLSKQPELRELRGRLFTLRDQVSTHLIVLIRQEQLKLGMTLQTVVTSNEDIQQKINETHGKVMKYLETISLQTQVESATGPDIGKSTGRSAKKEVEPSIWDAKPSEVQDLLKMSAIQRPFSVLVDSMERLAEQKRKTILQTLYFSQLQERELAVSEAHESTLEWIFDEVKPTNFVKWLRESDSIYWISGKAGSGKSTLMRFLTGHRKTLHLLKEWAGDSDLVTAKHYFWSPGTSIQKSQEGLFRALLLQILQQRQELIPVVCADRWDAPYEDAFYPWSRIQLVEALQRLGSLDDARWKICLFIDGLDEYNGDHAQLIDIIRKIADSDKIKICTSSRPWLEFSDAFEDSQWKLYLQNFTRGDIQQFIKDNLQNDGRFNKLRNRDSAAADGLVLEITERAHGVFLWVFLVVHSLLRGLRNEDDISDLQRRLRELPSNLYKFFDRMLATIEDVYRERVSRLFLTMTYAEATLPVITFYFMEFGDRPPSKEPLPFLREWPNVDLAEAEVLNLKKRQLIAQCKDLIHITSDPEAPVLFAERVGFLHRTVFDFLRMADMNEKLFQVAGKKFHPIKVLLRANIGQARSLIHLHRLTYIKPYLEQWILGSLYYAYSIEVSDGTTDIDALDELEAIIIKEFRIWGFPHAMEYLLDMQRITSFLELACRCDLALYITHKHPDYTPSKLDEIAPQWKKLFRLQQQATFEILTKETKYELDSDWRLGRQLGLLSSQRSGKLREESDVFDDTPDYLIYTRYHADHIKGTALEIQFKRIEWPDGEVAACGFRFPRLKDVLWPEALRTHNVNALREYMSRRLQFKPCPGQIPTEDTKGRVLYGMVDNDIEGFTACEACFEDYVVATSFKSSFGTYPEGVSQWSCDLSIPYITGAVATMSKYNNWNGFVTTTSRRLQLSACQGGQMPSDAIEWYLPNSYGIKGEFQRLSDDVEPELWSCGLADRNISTGMALEAALDRRDFEVFAKAEEVICSLVPCTSDGIIYGNWWTMEGCEKFNICEACHAGFIQTRGLDHFFQLSDRESTTAYVCDFCIASPRFAKYILKFAEMLHRGVFAYFSDFVMTFAGVPACPKLGGYGKSKWWGYPEAPFCQECYIDFVAHTPLAESLPMNGEYIEQATLCHIWSPRMRSLWLEVCEAGEPGSKDSDAALKEFKTFCVQRLQIYHSTILEMEVIRTMQNIKWQTAMSHAKLSLQYSGMEGMANIFRQTDGNRYGNSSIGWFKTSYGARSKQFWNSFTDGLSDSNRLEDWVRMAQLEAIWKGLE